MSLFEALFKYPSDAYAQGELTFLSRWPAEVRLLLTVALIALAWWSYRAVSERLATRPRRWLLGLRIAEVVLLMFILGAPALRTVRARASAVFTAVLVDTSRSMSIEDVGTGEAQRSRIDAAKRVLGGRDGKGLLRELRGLSKVLVYGFDVRAARQPGLDRLQATGALTNLFRAFRDVDADLRALPLAAVVLLTDGCRNDGGRGQDAAKLLEARS